MRYGILRLVASLGLRGAVDELLARAEGVNELMALGIAENRARWALDDLHEKGYSYREARKRCTEAVIWGETARFEVTS